MSWKSAAALFIQRTAMLIDSLVTLPSYSALNIVIVIFANLNFLMCFGMSRAFVLQQTVLRVYRPALIVVSPDSHSA